jgi:L-lactate dehydrogenase complex protein LldG
MSTSDSPNLIEKVRKALGRAQPLAAPPMPPALDDSLRRLVPRDANLTEVFIKSATDAKFKIDLVREEDVVGKLIEFLSAHACRKIGLPASPLLDRLNVCMKLKQAEFDVLNWHDLTLDAAYELDCGVTDVHAAVAETGSIMIRPDPNHGRALSLLPKIHVAIIEPANLVPDLIDLFEQLSRCSPTPTVTLITGPSKTADIEGALVTGVHGPGIVQLFLIK